MTAKYLKSFTIAACLLMGCSFSSAHVEDQPIAVDLTNDPEHIDDGPVRHRVPGRPITCIIERGGISAQGFDTSEIYLYEVYDSDGEPMASFTEMHDFIDYIFSATETIEIRLHIDGFMLCGYIYI